jgi:hypothetical protein
MLLELVKGPGRPKAKALGYQLLVDPCYFSGLKPAV